MISIFNDTTAVSMIGSVDVVKGLVEGTLEILEIHGARLISAWSYQNYGVHESYEWTHASSSIYTS
jgi:hypothetical protein